MEQPITPFDLHRMFLGDYPPLFYLEVLFRVVVIYGWTMLLIRWIGGRGVAQLSMVEFLLVIALGSAVGDAMFYEDVPLLVAMLVITAVVLINKILDKLIVRSQRAEAIIDGSPVAILREGVLVTEGMHARDLGTDEVKAMLRNGGVSNLGQVEYAFLEVNGGVSVFRFASPRPGLSIVPPSEVVPPQPLTHPHVAPKGLACCAACGRVERAAQVLPDTGCPNCGARCWTAPVFPPEPETLAEA